MLSACLPMKDQSSYRDGERPTDPDLTEPMLERHGSPLAETRNL
jgi:hypothetical protein